MNQEIIRMAREAGFEDDDDLVLEPEVIWYISQAQLERFFHMARAAEREALLDLVDDYAENNADLKAAIRARGSNEA